MSAARAANRNQVSIYAIDSNGLAATPGGGDSRARGVDRRTGTGFHTTAALRGIGENQQFLRHASLWTGGEAFLNNNDLGRGIRQVYADAREYYLLAYRPKGRRKAGKTYRIKVKLKRPDLRLRYRNRYQHQKVDWLVQDRLSNAIQFPGLVQEFPIRAQVKTEGDRNTYVAVIDPAALRFAEHEGRYQVTLEVFGFPVGEEGRLLAEKPVFAQRYRYADLKLEQVEALLATPGLGIEMEPDLPEETHEYLVVVRQTESGRLGTVRFFLDW